MVQDDNQLKLAINWNIKKTNIISPSICERTHRRDLYKEITAFYLFVKLFAD